jgi:hypothetical protein
LGISAECRGILGVQDGIERLFIFFGNIKAFLDGLLLIFHAKETCKSTTHNPAPHPMSLTMITVLSHDGPIFITAAIFQLTK